MAPNTTTELSGGRLSLAAGGRPRHARDREVERRLAGREGQRGTQEPLEGLPGPLGHLCRNGPNLPLPMSNHNARLSCGRTGSCFDSAVAEYLFAMPKNDVPPEVHPSRSRGEDRHGRVQRVLLQPLEASLDLRATNPRLLMDDIFECSASTEDVCDLAPK